MSRKWSSRKIVGTVFWFTIVGPACALAPFMRWVDDELKARKAARDRWRVW